MKDRFFVVRSCFANSSHHSIPNTTWAHAWCVFCAQRETSNTRSLGHCLGSGLLRRVQRDMCIDRFLREWSMGMLVGAPPTCVRVLDALKLCTCLRQRRALVATNSLEDVGSEFESNALASQGRKQQDMENTSIEANHPTMSFIGVATSRWGRLGMSVSAFLVLRLSSEDSPRRAPARAL